MIVSWNWLTDYVRLEMSAEDLADRLALTGLNHEGTEEVDKDGSGVDLAIDLEVTSNRSDCLSHLGVAREIAAIFGNRNFHEPDPTPTESTEDLTTITSVRVDAPSLCPRFTARVIRGAKVGPSPWWLRKRLETVGLRSINNIADITNYVMLECGQPLHAYDLMKLHGERLIVRNAENKESLVAINGKTYTLDAEMLVIADQDRAVGLAGVMGGLETEISDATSAILIEAALFDPLSIRRTARALGLSSDASYRFERPMDPLRTEWASRRCAELILELAGGTLVQGVIDIRAEEAAPPTSITLRFGRIEQVLGIEVPVDRAFSILDSIGIETIDHNEVQATFKPPSWRSDLDREIDLIEEVARIYGYEHIPEDQPVPLAASSLGKRERVERALRDAMTGVGFDEALTFSLVADELVAPWDPEPVESPIRAEHPDFKKNSALRQSLIPSLLVARAYNEAHGTPDARLFEIAHVYLPRAKRELPDERPRIGLVAGLSFVELKGVLESILERLHPAGRLSTRASTTPLLSLGRSAELLIGENHLGYLGEIDPDSASSFGLRGPCSAAELNLEPLIELANLVPTFQPIPTYPSVSRDLSLVVPLSLPWASLAELVQSEGGPSLEAIEFLDTFQGAGIADDHHSLHFGLTFRHFERTLTGDEVDRQIENIIEACQTQFGATLRT